MSETLVKTEPGTTKQSQNVPEFGTSFGDRLNEVLKVTPGATPEDAVDDKQQEPLEAEPEQVAEEPHDGQEPEPVADEPEPEPEPENADDDLSRLLADDDEAEPEQPEPETPDEEPESAEDAVNEAELEEMRDNPHTPEKTRKSIDRLLATNKRLKEELDGVKVKVQEAEDLRKRVEELESGKGDEGKKLSTEEAKELAMLRRRFSLDKDETIKREYDERIESGEQTMISILDKTLSDDESGRKQLEKVKQMGFVNFARSHPKLYGEFLTALDQSDPVNASIVRNKVGEVESLKVARENRIQEMSKDAESYFKEQQEKQELERKQYDDQVQAQQQMAADYLRELTTSDPVFALVDASKLTGEKKRQADAENQRRQNYHKDIESMIQAQSPEEVKTIIYKAALHGPITNKLRAVRAELDKLKKEKSAVASRQSIRTERGHVPEPKPKQTKPMGFGETIDALASGKLKAEDLRS